jgi:UDP-2-acetamido-2,6-beta-L-arabino-hexul-4-ose reductase
MKSQVMIEPVPVFSDPRGWVLEPIPEQLLGAQRNAHLALTEPGCVRGNHYHTRSTEIIVVTGPSLVRIREGGRLRDVGVPEGQAFRFTIPQGISHAIQNQGAKPVLLVAFNTLPHDRDHPDAVRDVLIEK